MKTTFIVLAAIFNQDNKLLLLQNADDNHAFPNKWGLCAGHIQEFEGAEEGIIREIKEETGLDATITKAFPVMEATDESMDKAWIAKPFICNVQSSDVTLCHENQAYEWVTLDELDQYDIIELVKKDLKHMELL